MGSKRVGVTAALASVLAASPAAAQTVTLGPSRDTTLFEESTAFSNGAGDYMFTGLTDAGHLRRALLAFDVGAAIPAGSTIDGATLTLHLSRTKVSALDVSLHRLLADWGESTSDAGGQEGAGGPAALGDATWTHRFWDTTTWATLGGDFAASASATTSVGMQPGDYAWSSSGMVADVQLWLDDPSQNHGWAIVAGVSATKQTKRFDTRDIADPAVQPRLEVSFTSSAPTGACCAADGSCSAVFDPGLGCAGVYQGASTDCATTACPQPTGACCTADAAGTCSEVTADDCAAVAGTFRGVGQPCTLDLCPVIPTPFLDPLPLPSAAAPVVGTAGGAATYVMAIRQFSQTLHSELPPTVVWGFDDGVHGPLFPGPTIEAASGEPVTVTWQNDLRDAASALLTSHYLAVDTCPHGAVDDSPRTVIHLHGGHVPESADGHPDATFLPGQEVVYGYPNAQPAGTLWYHDHSLGITRLNVYMGLAGFYVVRDAVEEALGLPEGADEIPLVIQDRSFKSDGSLRYPAAWQEHFFGEVVLVNGRVWPSLAVGQGKVRFRILNGSGSRTYHLSFDNGAPFVQLGTDDGLLPAPVPVSALLLTPGERADVVVDFEPFAAGTEMVLLNDAAAPYPGPAGEGAIPNVMKVVVTGTPGHTAPLPATLATLAPADESVAVTSRDFFLSKVPDPCTGGTAWRINGLGWDDLTELPKLGTSEVWRFVNDSGVTHPMHMHLVAFRVLDRTPFVMSNGIPVPTGPAVPPAPEEAGLKDTVRVDPGEMVRVLARFDDYEGRFAYHCHILEHEDHEMMRQFQTVVECGDGVLGAPVEACDDGNLVDGDGCSSECSLEGGGGAGAAGVGGGAGGDGGEGGDLPGGAGGAGTPDAGAGSSEDDGCGCWLVGVTLERPASTRGASAGRWGLVALAIAAGWRRRRAYSRRL